MASEHSSECVNNLATAVNLREVCRIFLVEGAADCPELQPSEGWFVTVKRMVRSHNIKLTG
jgi:hypothetical protein